MVHVLRYQYSPSTQSCSELLGAAQRCSMTAGNCSISLRGIRAVPRVTPILCNRRQGGQGKVYREEGEEGK